MGVNKTESGELLELGQSVARACLDAARADANWKMTGERRGQHAGDVRANDAATELLRSRGVNVFSEEADLVDVSGRWTAVIDPIDGSTNASRGLPYWASSICFVGPEGPYVSVVAIDPLREVFTAVRGQGAWLNGSRIRSTLCEGAGLTFVNGFPLSKNWSGQMRALGSAAAELCFVACGRGDAFIDFSGGLASWDYFGAALVLEEAGGTVLTEDGNGVFDTLDRNRRRILAAGCMERIAELRGLRSRGESGGG